MDVAELYVLLGVKGDSKLVSALTKVKTGLGEAASMSLEAKAGILGALYALEKFTAASGSLGTHLENFSALTGISTAVVQQYDYAARQVGVSSGAIEGSLKNLQSAMTNIDFGKGTPEYLLSINQALTAFGSGAIDFSRKWDTAYVFQKLREFAQLKNVDARIKRQFATTLLGDEVLAGAMRGGFTPSVLNQAPTYTPKQTESLAKSYTIWSNIGAKIEKAVGDLNAAHGVELATDISKIVTEAVNLEHALVKVAETYKLFDKLGKILEGTANSLRLIRELTNLAQGGKSKPGDLLYQDPKETAEAEKRAKAQGIEDSGNAFKAWWSEQWSKSAIGEFGKSAREGDNPIKSLQRASSVLLDNFKNGVGIKPLSGPQSSNHTTNNNKVSLTVPPGTTEPKVIADAIIKEIDDFTRQVGSQGQGA